MSVKEEQRVSPYDRNICQRRAKGLHDFSLHFQAETRELLQEAADQLTAAVAENDRLRAEIH